MLIKFTLFERSTRRCMPASNRVKLLVERRKIRINCKYNSNMSNSYFKKINSTITSIINSLPKTRLNSLKTKALKPLAFLIWASSFFVRSPLKCNWGMTPDHEWDPYITHHDSTLVTKGIF